MHLEELKTFIAVVDSRNFTKAGSVLNISQPTVSLHIKNLEDELNVALLVRSNKSFHITEAGRLLYERAKQLLQLASQTKEEIQWQQKEVSGILRIAASYTIGESILPDVLHRLFQKYPDLQFEVSIENTEDVEAAVRELRCDIGCIEGSIEAKELLIQPFMEDKLILVANHTHPLGKTAKLDVKDLQSAHWIMREKGSGTREYTNYILNSIGQIKPPRTIIGSNEGVKKLVLCGLGIAAVSIHTVRKEIDSGELVPLNFDIKLPKRTFSTLHSPLADDKRHIAVFLDELQGFY
ncbi:LysR family transcriptional regulator [Sporosarcina sp. Marseille-Q4063]|uniref:LysR substrate-binding domain-containing protein n=1 Tax=Sporosarcina sp. Marseille-Q4063 TaxID=2810514 RepID=UPI001BAF0A33|nr:LysR substrate-binding domain-containing protein [Sporosarcina sp. Marseille-Q4063]QUW20860.1 LysR family transcriptional regulator [Sporosarcina sp. Marseille-Q4063]